DSHRKSRRAGMRDARIAVARRLQQGRESSGGMHVVIDNQYASGALAQLPGLCQRMRGHDSCSTKAHGTRVLVARFEALDLPLGFIARDAVRLFNLIRKTRAPARNHVEVTGGEPPPVCVHFAPELLPVDLRGIPVHLGLLSPCGPAVAGELVAALGSRPGV